ncbi:uncharacterized protein [Triticum aestivum]|uniref:uncharacterized protein n=1 Tax=Triticum aestivum TaxID=4565 RepID=UPI001D003F48|nr:uncharacterized protein LOC123047638 [Triticum aestivum]
MAGAAGGGGSGCLPRELGASDEEECGLGGDFPLNPYFYRLQSVARPRPRPPDRVGLPRKKPREFKPAFDLPEALAAAADGHVPSWDAEGSVVKNYSAFGVLANPNLLGAHSRGTRGLVQSASLQAPDVDALRAPVDEFGPVDTGSDLECDDCNKVG